MTNVQSLLFYVLCFLLAGVMMHAGHRRNFKPFVALGLAIPIAIGGLRYNVGTDYTTYIDSIHWLKDVPVSLYVSDFSSYLEPTFYIFARLSYLFDFPYLVFLIYSAISVIFFYKALNMSKIKNVGLVYLLFLLIMFPMSFNLVRQFAAISIATYATISLLNGHKKKYYLFTVVASLFHVSALINILSLIVNRRINDRNRRSISAYKFIFGIIMISLTILLSWRGLQKYGYLFEIESTTTNLNFIPRLLILLTVLTLWYSSRSTYNRYKLFINLGMLCIALGLTGFFVPYGDRLALYFLPYIIILFPTSVYNLMPDNKKHLTSLAVASVGILYFIVSYYVMESHAIIPYRTILEASI